MKRANIPLHGAVERIGGSKGLTIKVESLTLYDIQCLYIQCQYSGNFMTGIPGSSQYHSLSSLESL